MVLPILLRGSITVGLVALLSALLVAPAGAAETTLVPVNGFQPLVPVVTGDEGTSVIRLQYTLRQHGFYRGPVDGEYGRTTETAVIAFQKYLGLERDGQFDALDWIRLALLPPPEIPNRWDEPDRVEIDIGKQLIYVIRDQEVVGILPTSTGSGGTYFSVRSGQTVRSSTPRGDFHFRWHQTGWSCDSVTGWCVYKYWAFTDFYGIHGYNPVPVYPASHGCSRVHLWDADWLEDYLYVGMPVHIWDEPPVIPRPPPPPAWVAA